MLVGEGVVSFVKVDDVVLENGKEVSSNVTFLETISLLLVGSRHI
jgi:hypothetical protein